MQPLEINYADASRAFTSQSSHFDADEKGNLVLADWRQRIYQHVEAYLKPGSSMLELNAGTGIDAVHFTASGHRVLATDVSEGMIRQLEQKAESNHLLTVRKLSFEHLDILAGNQFDYVFSNFGGLNCANDLSRITKHLPALLHPGAYVTFVIMPPVCPWEWLWIFKGKWKDAFRRFSKQGAKASIEGIQFTAFYHSPSRVKAALGGAFRMIGMEGLGIFSPPPSALNFISRYPRLYSSLRRVDSWVQRRSPFNRWGDHVILTFQYLS